MIAYISPLIPKKTGIALYSHHLIKALAPALADKGIALTAFDDNVNETNQCQQDYTAEEILPLIFEATRRQKYSLFVYHFGNNPSFHLHMLRLLQLQKGIVVLHDTVLYYLIAGQGTGALWQALARHEPDNAFMSVKGIIQQSDEHDILRYSSPEETPLLHEVLRQAVAVVVHSRLAQELVHNAGFKGSIHQVPLVDYQQTPHIHDASIENTILSDLLKQKALSGTFIIGLFGFAGKTKRSKSIFKALQALPDDLKRKIKLLIVGNNLYQADIKAMGLTDVVTCVGYVSDDDYNQSMAASDLVINLRYPSMGETSAVQIQAMSASKATIVSNDGWFCELPDQAALKIAVDAQEVGALKNAIIKMTNDDLYRLSVAKQAKRYVDTYHSPQHVAHKWLSVLSEL